MTALEGQYRYLHNGAPAPVQETWTVSHESAVRTRVESIRQAPGIEVQVTATLQAGAVCACSLIWKSEQLGELGAEYLCQEDGIRFQRDDGSDSQLLPHPADGVIILYPLMRIFTGPVIRAVAERGGKALVLVPFIGDPEDRGRLLSPDLSWREVRRLADGDDHHGDCWQFIGGQYDESARFWLGREDTLSRYHWQQDGTGAWDVRLQPGSHDEGQ